jgi:hypothetical protein
MTFDPPPSGSSHHTALVAAPRRGEACCSASCGDQVAAGVSAEGDRISSRARGASATMRALSAAGAAVNQIF